VVFFFLSVVNEESSAICVVVRLTHIIYLVIGLFVISLG
jgi:hypothetical protein